MKFGLASEELAQWSARKRAIEDIEKTEGYRLLMTRMQQEEDAAAEDILKCGRWNWFRILKALIRRDVASVLRIYIMGVKSMGEHADKELYKRDPKQFKETQRVAFAGK